MRLLICFVLGSLSLVICSSARSALPRRRWSRAASSPSSFLSPPLPSLSAFSSSSAGSQADRRRRPTRQPPHASFKFSDEGLEDDEKEEGNLLDELMSQSQPVRWDLPLAGAHGGDNNTVFGGSFAGKAAGEFDLPLSLEDSENEFFRQIAQWSPRDLTQSFMAGASPQAKEVAISTVRGFLGTIPKFSLETTVLTTGERLAALIWQVCMAGYILKHAEYRYRLSGAMEEADVAEGRPKAKAQKKKGPSSSGKKKGGGKEPASEATGTISLTTSDGRTVEADVSEYVRELEAERDALKQRLSRLSRRIDRQRELSKADEEGRVVMRRSGEYGKGSEAAELMAYMKMYLKRRSAEVTNLPDDLVEAIKQLTKSVLLGMGGARSRDARAETILQQTGTSLAQLCLWQIAIGYKLRELEMNQELRQPRD